MEKRINQKVQRVIQLRKQFRELEIRLSQHSKNIPPDIWQELVEISVKLEQAEKDILTFYLDIANDINQSRAEIITTIGEYTSWRDQMRENEEFFLANILRPGYYLKQSIRQREYLEKEYNRIHKGILYESYSNQQELETDIHNVIVHGKAVYDSQENITNEELLNEVIPDPISGFPDVDDIMVAISKEELIREFKRLVIPAVHPDTSDTSVEVFNTVYDFYQRGDTLMMEAYIVEYRGDVSVEPDDDPLESLDLALITQMNYKKLSSRLQRRVEQLKNNLSAQELENPKKVQKNMLNERQEILNRIQNEAEQILYWRDKIESLLNLYLTHHGKDLEK